MFLPILAVADINGPRVARFFLAALLAPARNLLKNERMRGYVLLVTGRYVFGLYRPARKIRARFNFDR